MILQVGVISDIFVPKVQLASVRLVLRNALKM